MILKDNKNIKLQHYLETIWWLFFKVIMKYYKLHNTEIFINYTHKYNTEISINCIILVSLTYRPDSTYRLFFKSF